MPEAASASVRAFIESNIKARSALLTDAWAGYGGLSWRGYPHAAIPRGDDRKLLRRFFPCPPHGGLSNPKRFWLGTHHKPQAQHLNRYVAEFTCRFNRRGQERSLFHRLTLACLATNTITYKDLTAQPELA